MFALSKEIKEITLICLPKIINLIVMHGKDFRPLDY